MPNQRQDNSVQKRQSRGVTSPDVFRGVIVPSARLGRVKSTTGASSAGSQINHAEGLKSIVPVARKEKGRPEPNARSPPAAGPYISLREHVKRTQHVKSYEHTDDSKGLAHSQSSPFQGLNGAQPATREQKETVEPTVKAQPAHPYISPTERLKRTRAVAESHEDADDGELSKGEVSAQPQSHPFHELNHSQPAIQKQKERPVLTARTQPAHPYVILAEQLKRTQAVDSHQHADGGELSEGVSSAHFQGPRTSIKAHSTHLNVSLAEQLTRTQAVDSHKHAHDSELSDGEFWTPTSNPALQFGENVEEMFEGFGDIEGSDEDGDFKDDDDVTAFDALGPARQRLHPSDKNREYLQDDNKNMSDASDHHRQGWQLSDGDEEHEEKDSEIDSDTSSLTSPRSDRDGEYKEDDSDTASDVSASARQRSQTSHDTPRTRSSGLRRSANILKKSRKRTAPKQKMLPSQPASAIGRRVTKRARIVVEESGEFYDEEEDEDEAFSESHDVNCLHKSRGRLHFADEEEEDDEELSIMVPLNVKCLTRAHAQGQKASVYPGLPPGSRVQQPWSKEEDEILFRLRNQGKSWKYIGERVLGRTETGVVGRWEYLRRESFKPIEARREVSSVVSKMAAIPPRVMRCSAWSKKEEETLITLRAQGKTLSYISRRLRGRNYAAVKTHWCKIKDRSPRAISVEL